MNKGFFLDRLLSRCDTDLLEVPMINWMLDPILMAYIAYKFNRATAEHHNTLRRGAYQLVLIVEKGFSKSMKEQLPQLLLQRSHEVGEVLKSINDRSKLSNTYFASGKEKDILHSLYPTLRQICEHLPIGLAERTFEESVFATMGAKK